MKTVFVAASVLGIASSSAADLATRPYVKAPPVVAAAYDWSGFYAGANGGGAWGRSCWDALPFPINIPALGPPFNISGPEGCNTASGGTAGGQIGYRWQQSSWVFGLEAQGNWADLTGSNPSQIAPFFTGFANRTRIDAIGLFTGQVGYAWGTFLLYAKGGAAVVHDRYDSFLTAPLGTLPAGFVSDTGSETRWGAAVGVGGEYAFTPNWSVALEYDHLFMDSSTVHMTYDPAFIAQLNHDERIRQDIDMVTVRLDYRFGGAAVAKY